MLVHMQLTDRTVIIGIGLPGCGKTTLLKPLAEEKGYTYVNADDIREELTGDMVNHTQEPAVWALLHDRVATALLTGGVVIDATFTRTGDRRRMAAFCRENGASEIIGYWIDTPLWLCKERNAARNRNVLDEAINKMANRLAINPPDVSEGFDNIERIRQ